MNHRAIALAFTSANVHFGMDAAVFASPRVPTARITGRMTANRHIGAFDHTASRRGVRTSATISCTFYTGPHAIY